MKFCGDCVACSVYYSFSWSWREKRKIQNYQLKCAARAVEVAGVAEVAEMAEMAEMVEMIEIVELFVPDTLAAA